MARLTMMIDVEKLWNIDELLAAFKSFEARIGD